MRTPCARAVGNERSDKNRGHAAIPIISANFNDSMAERLNGSLGLRRSSWEVDQDLVCEIRCFGNACGSYNDERVLAVRPIRRSGISPSNSEIQVHTAIYR